LDFLTGWIGFYVRLLNFSDRLHPLNRYVNGGVFLF
jgi:hypothetical protein